MRTILDFTGENATLPRAAHLNEIIAAIRDLDAADGYDLRRPPGSFVREVWLGKVQPTDADGSRYRTGQYADDERYWVQRQWITAGNSEDSVGFAANMRTTLDFDPAAGFTTQPGIHWKAIGPVQHPRTLHRADSL